MTGFSVSRSDSEEAEVIGEHDVPEGDVPEVDLPEEPARRRWLLVALVLVGVLVMVSGLVAWWHADHDSQADRAAVRDVVLIAATSDIETMNTLDYRHIDAGLAGWRAVTTGTLHDQLTQVSAQDRALLAQQQKISTGKVVDAAVVDLGGSTATVIASVEVTVRDGADAAAQPTVKRNRFTADMVNIGGTWKLETLDQVAVSMQ